MNRKAEIFYRLGEPLPAGMFEIENATVVERYGRGLRRYFEHAVPPPAESGHLYPAPSHDIWRLAGQYVLPDYSFSYNVRWDIWNHADKIITDPFEHKLLEKAVRELNYFRTNLVPDRFAIGGNGFTHSILNYRRILKDGLKTYRQRVHDMPEGPLRNALIDVLAGITDFLKRCPGDIAECAENPAKDFYSAMKSFNFFYALDGYDSAGRFDDYMGGYYNGEADAQEWLEELYQAVDNHSGWHFIHTGKYPEFTKLCIQAHKVRRPNAGLLLNENTPEEIYEALFDSWGRGMPCPSVYNETAYLKAIEKHASVSEEDREHFAFGGCTELMYEGCSNIGSVDAGINLLDILNNSTPENYYADIKRKMDELADSVRLQAEFSAKYRPHLIRTLFIDDCIEKNLEYNAGGARNCGSVICVAGLTNAINALAAMKGIPEKFGNDSAEVDKIASDLSEYVFSLIQSYPMRLGGDAYPGIIMFVTYTQEGAYVDASADGRCAGAPIADSVGAVAGTDTNGPTALLNSVAKLPSDRGLGTLILNMRIQRKMASDPEKRKLLKALIQGFFRQGGLQIQPTLIDQETLQKAYSNPEEYPNLVIRIGGYSEYFTRLSRQLQEEVMKRNEHTV